MKKKDEKAVYFFTFLVLIIMGLVIFSPNFPKGISKVAEAEQSIEINAQAFPEAAYNLVGQPYVKGKATCEDSDGLNYEVKGYVSGYDSKGRAYKKYDICLSGRYEGYVKEYYCARNRARSRKYKCPHSCSDGACIKECISEGQKGNMFNDDTCCEGLTRISTSYLSGDTCVPATPDGSFICAKCGNGICGPGENRCNCQEDCVVTPTCTDSDGGKNYYVKGTTTGSPAAGGPGAGVIMDYTDKCDQNSQLIEYYCDEFNLVNLEDYLCPYGCKDGACAAAGGPVCGNGVCEGDWEELYCPEDCLR